MLTHAENLDWLLMRNNISWADLDVVIEFLRQDDPILPQSKQVQAFEQEWSDWVGVKYSVFLNFYGVYLGNYPELEKAKISKLCSILNRLPGTR